MVLFPDGQWGKMENPRDQPPESRDMGPEVVEDRLNFIERVVVAELQSQVALLHRIQVTQSQLVSQVAALVAGQAGESTDNEKSTAATASPWQGKGGVAQPPPMLQGKQQAGMTPLPAPADASPPVKGRGVESLALKGGTPITCSPKGKAIGKPKAISTE